MKRALIILGILAFLVIGSFLFFFLKGGNAINKYVFGDGLLKDDESPNPPIDLGCERVEFLSSDGAKIIGWFFPSKTSAPGIIISSGLLYERDTVLKYAATLKDAGYNILVFDPRGQGLSAGVYALGAKEPEDIAGALCWMHKEGIKKIALLGYSCGATAAIIAAAQHPNEISAVIADSPIANLKYIGGKLVKRALGTPLIMPICNFLASKKLGYNLFEKTDALKVAGRVSHIFFIHGEEDTAVSPKSSEVLYEKAREPKELWLVPGANHVEAMEIKKAEYRRRVLDFLAKYLE